MSYRKWYSADAYARAGRRQADSLHAQQRDAMAARAAKRAELQPEYEALDAWHTAQMREHGLSTELQTEMGRRLAELDARVAAAAPM